MLIPAPAAMRDKLHAANDPAPAKDAATIAVVRAGRRGLEVFLMRRQASMAFAAGMYVFPGGGVHEADAEPLPWFGPDAAYFAARFGCSLEAARALVVAAARETFEETGVLIAGSDEHSVVSDVTPYHDARLALERHELSFGEFLRANGLALRADLLGAWAHWITPGFEPRRFDTRFFVAKLPAGQRIDTVSDEADASEWVPLDEVLARVERGVAAMMPPTRVTCSELARESAETVLQAAAARRIEAIEPRLVEIDGKLWLDTGTES